MITRNFTGFKTEVDLIYSQLTVLSNVQKGKACGERDVGVGDVHSKGIGSLAAPRITAS